MTVAIASGDRQRIVIVSDTLAIDRDSHRPVAFFTKTMVFPHVMAAAVVRGHGGHKREVFHALNIRPALGGIGALPWPEILADYIAEREDAPFDVILAGWSPPAGGFALWRLGEATGYELAGVSLPATVATPDFGTELDPVMTDAVIVRAAECQVDLVNQSAREQHGADAPVHAGGDLIMTVLTAAGIEQCKVKRLAGHEALREQMA